MATKDFVPRKALESLDEERFFHLNRLSEMGLNVAAFVHEVGQPMTAIKASLQLARAEALSNPELRDLIDRALAQSERAESLFTSMREYLRPAPRRQELVDLTEIAPRVVHTLTSGGASRGISITCDCPPGELEVIGDPRRIEQIIHNLVGNARDAVSEAGGGTVLVVVEESEDERIVLLVADDGIGVPMQNRQRIFEPFFTTKKPDEGTGLGLYVVQKIVDEMGARLELLDGHAFVEPPLSQMSTVLRVEFPGASRVTTVPPLPEPGANATPHVLVVDDEPAIATLLAKALTAAGLKVTTAHSGEQAVAALERDRFDALLADKNLPGLTGLDVARLARSFNPRLPVVIITAFPSEDSARSAASLGVAEYISKPLDLDHTVDRMLQLLAQARSRSSAPSQGKARARPSWLDVPVVLIEPNDERRTTIAELLGALQARVVAFSTPRLAVAHLTTEPFSIVAAPAEVLSGNPDWFRRPPSGLGVLGSIVIMDRGGVDKAITAIQLGARGMISPPFDKATIEAELRRAIERLIEEKLSTPTGG